MTKVTTETHPADAVIIPHYNDIPRLERCLSALTDNDISNTEIIVVDNASPVSLDQISRAFPKVRFVVETQKGAAHARNRGVAETTAPRLFFIDADCVPASDWLTVGRRIADRADLIGGRVDVFDETPAPRSGAEAFEAVFAFNFRRYIEVQGFSGAGNLLTRRDVFDAIGGFLNGVSEDREWTMRAVSRGYSLIYEDDFRVSHPSRQDWPALKAKWRRTTQEAYQLNGTDLSARLRWALRGLAMPASAVVHTPKVLASNKLGSAGETMRAVATLIRLRCTRMVWMLLQAAGGRI
ncbi:MULTISPECIES: glycosyltransferase family 2 protein [unclassified Ruegeria]|uniref:glycosyltransferase family 2 protein n=1 Tax=unclassified Ruegeria TaxID=2625375 RepID=UPI001492BF36|nr:MULTISPECIES: glycosyltransferase family A protein [unclassified Ruegeria]NOD90916.1 glycosyltransferase [Ruegeria sp. HKCCD4318]NOE16304.1 glycosyltransferase [Ruegeria sp. HKCCD4318-2]NOG11770.1 glycosyltransferase family 2 protein [Ruegeria sp. HKCCD4315]